MSVVVYPNDPFINYKSVGRARAYASFARRERIGLERERSDRFQLTTSVLGLNAVASLPFCIVWKFVYE
ncbi:MAG TPA: hypothetical protein VF074_10440 [Pyrinomonadaceae bacterium]